MPSTRKPASLFALIALWVGTIACQGDGGSGGAASSSAPGSASAPASDTTDRLPTGPPPEMAFGAGGSSGAASAGAASASASGGSADGSAGSDGIAAGAGGLLGMGGISEPGGGRGGEVADSGGAASEGGAAGQGEGGQSVGGQGGGGEGGRDGGDEPLNMAPVTFGANVMVNEQGRGRQTEVIMAVRDDGLILAGWIEGNTNPSSCGFSISPDGGETWGNNFFARTQAGAGAFAGDPAVAIDKAGNLYAGCQDYASGGLGTNYILLAHSEDDGDTWSDFARVQESLDKPWLGGGEDGTVLVSWLGDPGGVKRSTDYGDSWSEPISLGFINHGTILAVSETGLVHMAYNTGETVVTYRRSLDWGGSFEPAKDIADQGRACYDPCSPRQHPIVGGGTDPSGQVVAITWSSTLQHPDSEGDDDVWVIVSYDAGDTFSDPIRVNDNLNASRQIQPWAAVDKYGAVHVAWTDLRDNGQNATYYARMVDEAMGFETNVQVTDATGAPSDFIGDYKGIEVLGRDVVVIWGDNRNDSGDIYFARATDAAAAGGPLLQ